MQVLQALDAQQKEMFKQHEMGIEARRQEKLKKMTERDRLKAEEEFRKEAEARKANHVPPTSQPYTAGVVEFAPDVAIGSANVTHNLLAYNNLTAQAKLKGVQIIVFPEDSLTGFRYSDRDAIYPYLEELPPIPKPSTTIIPCKDPKYADSPIFQELSCIALRHKVVLVANMGEKQPCTSSDPHCPPNGRYQFDTDVVFEIDGSFVTKYHQFNFKADLTEIFDEPLAPEHITFTTSFGVTFGIFTCYDILFKDPPLVMVEKGVQNFIFTTAWGSQLPYFVPLAIQQAWSRTTGTTFLVANYHSPTMTINPSTGSGIYSSGTPLSTFASGEDFAPATGHLIVAELPKGPGVGQVVVDPDRVGTLWETGFQFKILDGTSPVSIAYESAQVNSTFTCSLSYSFKKHVSNETYGLGVLVNPRNEEYNAGCTLVKCIDASCTNTSYQPTTKASTVFSYISLSGDFPKGSVVFPVAISNQYKLLLPEQLHLESNTLTVKGANDPLISVSLWSILPSQV